MSNLLKHIKLTLKVLNQYRLGYFRLQKKVLGFSESQIIYVAVKLGIAENLNKAPKTVSELATDLQVNESALECIMNWLVSNGFISRDPVGKYQLTRLGSQLLPDTPDSLHGLILSSVELLCPLWSQLLYSIQTGKPGADATWQMGLYEYLQQNAQATANFNRWMEETTRDWVIPALELYSFAKVKTFVDVGGGTGTLTATLLSKYAHLQGILFDQDYILKGAPEILAAAQVETRCQVIAGNFFESVPTDGDLYLISRVLLNWDDTQATKLLENCRAAMTNTDKLLIADFVVQGKNKMLESIASLNTLVLSGKLLRTKEQYFALLSQTGFRSSKLITLAGTPLSLIEASPS
ncbi:MAG: methyltransferase [Symploca sp. SIO2E6]|nr:methyltransferase [Symploca sp. SIO2E6]